LSSQSEIVLAIESILREQVDLKPQIGDFGAETPLFEGGLELDSFGIVELIAGLETEFSIEFLEDDFLEEHFRTVGALGGLVYRYLNST
jgi:acyl carrier protein